MPVRASKRCATQGCTVIVSGQTRCTKHTYEWQAERVHLYQKSAQTLSYVDFYRSKEWRITRGLALQIEPLCRACNAIGLISPSSQVDHIVPISQGGDRLDMSNLQALCHTCHSRKTRIEQNEKRWKKS